MFQRLVSCLAKLFDDIDDFDKDPRGWSKDIATYARGEFSMAAVRANDVMEDHFQVETGGPNTLFLGVYDGHHGADAARYVSKKFLPNFLKRIDGKKNDDPEYGESIVPTLDIMWESVAETEEGFMNVVKSDYHETPELGHVGTCGLFCYIWKDEWIYISNLGDSRAVIAAKVDFLEGMMHVTQLTNDHNCNIGAAFRDQLKELHHDDPEFVVNTRDAWRVKGISKITRSIGDAYLKFRPEFITRQDFPKFKQVPEPYNRPVISPMPETYERDMRPEDIFLIVGSHGFWEFLTNEKATYIVRHKPREGIAKRLIMKALKNAAKKGGIKYKRLQQCEDRRNFHDDMSVIVVFFDHPTTANAEARGTEMLSYKGFTKAVPPSLFAIFSNKWPLQNLRMHTW